MTNHLCHQKHQRQTAGELKTAERRIQQLEAELIRMKGVMEDERKERERRLQHKNKEIGKLKEDWIRKEKEFEIKMRERFKATEDRITQRVQVMEAAMKAEWTEMEREGESLQILIAELRQTLNDRDSEISNLKDKGFQTKHCEQAKEDRIRWARMLDEEETKRKQATQRMMAASEAELVRMKGVMDAEYAEKLESAKFECMQMKQDTKLKLMEAMQQTEDQEAELVLLRQKDRKQKNDQKMLNLKGKWMEMAQEKIQTFTEKEIETKQENERLMVDLKTAKEETARVRNSEELKRNQETKRWMVKLEEKEFELMRMKSVIRSMAEQGTESKTRKKIKRIKTKENEQKLKSKAMESQIKMFRQSLWSVYR